MSSFPDLGIPGVRRFTVTGLSFEGPTANKSGAGDHFWTFEFDLVVSLKQSL
jgi:hypothetical protein